MAMALTRMRQFENAAVHFATILAAEPIPGEALGPLAEFIRLHPDEGPVASALELISRAGDSTKLPTLLQYAVVRSLIESRPRRAAELLQCVQIKDIDAGEVALDLAVQAFRLTNWALAAEASTHALSLCPGQRTPETVLISALSFARQLEDAQYRLRSSDNVPPAVHVRASQLSALKFLASQHKGSRPVCAVVVGDDDPRTPCKLITRDFEELSGDLADLPLDHHSSITVSVISSAYKDCGPWDVLAEIDWRVPHLMVQHLGAGPILHAFVGANDAPDCWAWQEAPVAFSAESASGATEFSFLAAESEPPNNRVPDINSLWRRIEPELDSLNPQIGVKR